MTTTKQYDFLNRLTQISSAPGGAGLLPYTYAYNYNVANQRTRNTFSDGSHWSYQYDWLGQVTNGGRYWSDGTPVAGQQYQYLFDTIGNRTKSWTGGDTNGANLRTASYSVNSVNQITQRDVPGTNDVAGAALVGTNVTINGVAADRKAEYFHGVVGGANASQPLWLTSTIIGANTTLGGHLYVAKEPEQFQYDLDGNLTSDGRWIYTWDGENRLIGMTVNTSAGPQYQLTFAYDWQGRRIQKVVATNNFLYDGWNLEAEMGSSGTLVRSYVWGADLSGQLQGAGGVGGLVETRYYGASTTNAFVAFDGNGNVSALINAADGSVVANYEYGPFGEVIRISGPLAKNNPLRFSTKYQDDESDLLYYGYRYYEPAAGRWINRDPAQEKGGLNIYGFVRDPEDAFDFLGLDPVRLIFWVWLRGHYPYEGIDKQLYQHYIWALNRIPDVNAVVFYEQMPLGVTPGLQKWACTRTYYIDVRASDSSLDPVDGITDTFAGANVILGWSKQSKWVARSLGDLIFTYYPVDTHSSVEMNTLVLAHETLHSVGATHVQDPNNIMYAYLMQSWVQSHPHLSGYTLSEIGTLIGAP